MPKLTKDNHIYAYYQQIKSGGVVVGRWIEAVYELLVQGLQNKQFFFDQKKANAAIDWIETHCFHVEGPLAPGPLKLELWQKAFVSAVFGIVDEKGNRQWREVVLAIGRKNGKSLLAAAMGNYEWRCGGYGSKVYVIAPKLEQADIIYNNIWMMTTLDPELERMKEIADERDTHNKRIRAKDFEMIPKHRMTDLMITGSNSTVKKIAYNAKRSDGFNPSLALLDEIAAWDGANGLKQYEVMKSGMGARPDGLLLSCTTSGYVNESIYDELIKRSTRFLLGDSKERRLLPFLYMIDDIEKWNDISCELRKSNPNLGVSVSVDFMLEEIAVAEGSLSKKAEFLTKYCCVKQNSSQAWLSAEVVQKACGEHLELADFANSYCVAGIDLSQSRDLTACNVVIEKNGELYVFSKFFLPAEKIEEATERDGVPYNIYIQRGLLQPSGDNFVDYNDCFNWFCELVEQYQIYPLIVGYDKYNSLYLTQQMEAYGFHMDSVFQGENLHPCIIEMQGLLEDGKLHIGDNDLLKMHLLNSAIKMSAERGRGKLVKLNPSLHIDGTAALLDAITVRQKHYGDLGEQLKNEG